MGRYLGQHFLINKKQLRKIVGALELKPSDTVIEIGPGHGELTQLIAERLQFLISNFQIIAIEKDKRLVRVLRKKFTPDKNIKIVEGDILKVLPKLITNYQLQITNYKIIGNIPYYITGKLFRILGELEHKPSLIVLTTQKEVAERICAYPPKMNLLAASVQFWAKPKIIGYISKKDFRPVPKVDSAIIKLSPMRIYTEQKADLPRKYYDFIRILFKQPRKTILNNLRLMTHDLRLLTEKLKSAGINPQARPQNLSIKQILELLTLF